jgi:hypothetical protein
MRGRRRAARGARGELDAAHGQEAFVALEAGAELVAPRGIVQPGAEHGLEVEVGDDQVLLERAGPGDRLAELVDDHRAAVEHQLVLPAHLVDERHDRDVVRRPRGHHALAVARSCRGRTATPTG